MTDSERDYVEQLETNLSSIYQEITGGLLSKPSYPLDTVLSVYHNRQSEKIDRHEAFNDITTILKNCLGDVYSQGLEDTIKEYLMGRV